MDADSKSLIKELKDAGLSEQAIAAAWPSWWDDDAASSPSARAELRFALSRHLGLAPQSLLGERVEFVWKNEARFKNLTADNRMARGALASFGVAVGQLLLRATPAVRALGDTDARRLRNAILANRPVVDLLGLLSACWGLGVPVIHLRVFPLRAKSMRAMVVAVDGRHAILMGRDSNYPSPTAFTLAHEIGHAALGHAGNGKALVDIGDPSFAGDDEEEREADAYGLELLTGSSKPSITTSTNKFGARSLAEACKVSGPPRGIEPGTLALCLGYLRDDWSTATAALRHIYPRTSPVWREINQVAVHELNWSALSEDSVVYLHSLLGTDD